MLNINYSGPIRLKPNITGKERFLFVTTDWGTIRGISAINPNGIFQIICVGRQADLEGRIRKGGICHTYRPLGTEISDKIDLYFFKNNITPIVYPTTSEINKVDMLYVNVFENRIRTDKKHRHGFRQIEYWTSTSENSEAVRIGGITW